MSKAKLSTWTVNWQPFITKKEVDRITKKATLKQKIRLFFRPSHYSIDGKYIIRYKQMDGIAFVIKRGSKL